MQATIYHNSSFSTKEDTATLTKITLSPSCGPIHVAGHFLPVTLKYFTHITLFEITIQTKNVDSIIFRCLYQIHSLNVSS